MTSLLLPLAADNPLTHVVDHARLQTSGGWTLLSNHMIMMTVAAVILLLVFPPTMRRYRDGELVLSGKKANFLEAMMLFVRDEVAKPVIGQDTHKYIGFLWTLFFFILTCNLLGLLPLDALQSPLYKTGFYPIYGTATANIAVTAVLAGVRLHLLERRRHQGQRHRCRGLTTSRAVPRGTCGRSWCRSRSWACSSSPSPWPSACSPT